MVVTAQFVGKTSSMLHRSWSVARLQLPSQYKISTNFGTNRHVLNHYVHKLLGD